MNKIVKVVMLVILILTLLYVIYDYTSLIKEPLAKHIFRNREV